ncbi:MAG: CRISPR-associated endonuclease Cas2 [Bacteroidota bacterium]|nr:CRISPR-associated endonuclease Cas2 [Bacteroidota bacterium]MXW14449.1 CRISPR-associated endonuclease Cas2 [Rhodothermaceae bacterium]MDE2646026.1 CRISPR-associated endonuclease Cas2 [Bacteroidota bacterium]MXW33335.1 CRISPR-associated endonuclease Cas2 [Rhodothermaceae bacterium]MXZ18162.1 CRISPR-associated endonuclease Cas2 [Rhodothermaceae bacterium]
MDILVTYDIADTDKSGASRLRQIAQVCEKYGQRIQFSVFECRLSPTRFARMTAEIEDIIDAQIDSVMIYRFSGNIDDAKMQFGSIQGHELDDPWIV